MAKAWRTPGENDPTRDDGPIPVTIDTFIRAESDMYFAAAINEGAFGGFAHHRLPTPIDRQIVVRMNRDTLYSGAVFDLEAGTATIVLPDPGRRFMSLQIINEDHYTIGVHYESGPHAVTREMAGTRYVLAAVRTLADPNDAADLARAHELQDAIGVFQKSVGRVELPNWDRVGQKVIRETLAALGAWLPDNRRTFGVRGEVEPVRHLIGTAIGWGGNPETEAMYVNLTPKRNDGVTPHILTVKDVPVEAFWSISVYNVAGFFEPNPHNAYSLNSLTASKDADGAVTVRFGEGAGSNCLPIMPGWTCIARLYRPSAEVLSGAWHFPKPLPAT
ncbi:MAG: DUF1254 domain-containing protein [Pseudomonadota bacterium]